MYRALAVMLLAVGLWGSLWYAKHQYDEARREEGREEMRPTIKMQDDRLKADIVAFKEVAAAFAMLKAKSDELGRASAQAAALEKRRSANLQTEIEAIRAYQPAGATKLERLEALIDEYFPATKGGAK